MHNKGYYYSYEACHCGGFIIMQNDPEHVLDPIREKGFTIKEKLDPYYFLGGDFERFKEPNTDNDIMTLGSKTYVKIMMEKFKNYFCFDNYKQHAMMPPD